MTRCRLFHKWGKWGVIYKQKYLHVDAAFNERVFWESQQDRTCSRCGRVQVRSVTT